MAEKYDVIIVGAGVAGLQLGALLAHDGMRTLILEKSSRVGGRAFVLEKDGYVLDYGIHLVRFGPKSAIARVIKHIGRHVDFVDVGTSYLLDEDGRRKVFPTKPITFLKTRMFSFSDMITALKTMARLRRGQFDHLLETPVKEWMDENGFKGGLRRYFHLVSASMLVCPFIDKASTGELLRNVQKVLRRRISVMYPRGGWKPLFNAWIETVNSNGRILTDSPVKEVRIKNGRATGVVIEDGREFEAEKVVVAVPVQHMFSFLDEKEFPPEFVSMCKNLRPTAGVFIDYCIKGKISDSTGLWYIWDPMCFGLFTSNLEPALAPPEGQILTFFYPRPVEEMEDPEKAKQRIDELEKAVFNLFPELQDRIAWRRAAHLTMVDGVEINIHQHRFKRPGFRAPNIPNLFLVGDSTAGDGAGGDVGHESVLECYSEMMGREV